MTCWDVFKFMLVVVVPVVKLYLVIERFRELQKK
jgi:hypothetical protein